VADDARQSSRSRVIRSRLLRGAGGDSVKLIRYAAAACQTDLPNPIGRLEMRANTDRMLSMIDSAVAGQRRSCPYG